VNPTKRGKRSMRRRREYLERMFVHVYDTGGLRPCAGIRTS
jgi:hypothetical protein